MKTNSIVNQSPHGRALRRLPALLLLLLLVPVLASLVGMQNPVQALGPRPCVITLTTNLLPGMRSVQPLCGGNPQYFALIINEINTGNGVCGGVSPGSGWYVYTLPPTNVTVKASWSTGCQFKGWVGSGPGSYTGQGTLSGSNPYYSTIQVSIGDGNATETATFNCVSHCQQ
jgi:hypothetical protein